MVIEPNRIIPGEADRREVFWDAEDFARAERRHPREDRSEKTFVKVKNISIGIAISSI